MSENPSLLVMIFTCISIISIIVSCTVIVTQADRHNMPPQKVIKALFYKYYYKNDTLFKEMILKKTVLIQLLMVVWMLPIAVFLINQLGMGNLKIRMDIQNFFNASFLATLAFFLIVYNKENKNTNGS